MPGASAHMLFAAPVALVVAAVGSAHTGDYQGAAVVCGVAGGLWPDWDHHGSTIARLPGRRSPLTLVTRGIAWVIQKTLKHRGPFHSLAFAFAQALICYFWLGPWAAAAFFLGYLSHLLADHALTRTKVPWLWPLGRRRKRQPRRRRRYVIDK